MDPGPSEGYDGAEPSMAVSPPEPEASADEAPALLDGRYSIVRTLGQGAMGKVYEGVHDTLGKPVAIKVLRRQLAADARSRKRLLREARAASSIHHPSVVEIIDFGETAGGSVFLVMELLQGRDLGAVLESGPLPWPRAVALLKQAASALQVAHVQGIIHRDIKPANCFVVEGSEGELIKLLDFGIAKVEASTDSTSGLTATGEIMGTVSYMAPELTFGTPASVATDVYALGMMAYELIAGAAPFRGKNPYEVLRRHIEETPPLLSSLVRGVPLELEAVVLRAIAKEPAERFESMAELEAALGAISVPSASPAPIGAGDPAGASPVGPTGTEVMTAVTAAEVDEDAATVAVATERVLGPGHAGGLRAPADVPGAPSAGASSSVRAPGVVPVASAEASSSASVVPHAESSSALERPRRGPGRTIAVVLVVLVALAAGAWLAFI